jgi:hypothetical protein
MDELVAKIIAATGADASVARRAAALILGFLLREGASDKVRALVDALPGAREAIAANPGSGGSGVMSVFNDLTAAGLGMGQIQGAAKAFVGYAREKAGAATVDQIVASVPGLSQFV